MKTVLCFSVNLNQHFYKSKFTKSNWCLRFRHLLAKKIYLGYVFSVIEIKKLNKYKHINNLNIKMFRLSFVFVLIKYETLLNKSKRFKCFNFKP
jgi:hypothetical protein